jgi:hypothetical protein
MKPLPPATNKYKVVKQVVVTQGNKRAIAEAIGLETDKGHRLVEGETVHVVRDVKD